MKTLIVIAIALFSVGAYADTYTCTGTNTAGIYTLDVDGGTASLTVDGMTHQAMGAGSEYMFNDTFAMGDVSFIATPTLYLPNDGSMSDIMFQAAVADDAGDKVEMTCSP